MNYAFTPTRTSSTYFTTRAAATSANPLAQGSDTIVVQETGELVLYLRDANGIDLIGADLSTWRRGSINQADLLQLAIDLGETVESPIITSGVFVPGIGFATVGDSVNAFGATRQGRWHRAGNRVSMDINFNTVSITHTTASGRLRVFFTDSGFTVNALDISGGRVRFLSPVLTLPADTIGLSLVPAQGQNYAEIAINRRDTADSFLNETHLTSGTSYILQLNFEFEL